MSFPLDILEYVIFPYLFEKDILKYFVGDPESGDLVLKDVINAPHLNIESQLYNIMKLSQVYKDTLKNPLDMSFTDKINFAKKSIGNYPASSRIKRKLVYKIANRIKPSNTIRLYNTVRNTYDNKVKCLKNIYLQDIRNMEPRHFNFGNIQCLGCNKLLPLYQPSVKKNWTRAISEGYEPMHLLKQACSKKCMKKCSMDTICACCYMKCKPGTEFYHKLNTLQYSVFSANPITRETSGVKQVEHRYVSSRLCSKMCYKIIHTEHYTLSNKYFIIRNIDIISPIGFLVNEEILQELNNNIYTIRSSVVILNPNAPEFVGNV